MVDKKAIKRLAFRCDMCSHDFILGHAISKFDDGERIWHIHRVCEPVFFEYMRKKNPTDRYDYDYD